MSVGAISSRINLRPGSSPFVPRSIQTRKRSRLKILANLEPPDNFFHQFSVALASAKWPELILPALGFGSGAAVVLSRSRRFRRRDENFAAMAVGNWYLVANSTPFNRCVFLRCPSVSFGDGKLLFDSAIEQHQGRGRILATEADPAARSEVSYQRLCLGMDDGGVISLDWPDHLELAGEQGLDSTLLVVPGTPDGSMDDEVRSFVREALGHGVFPIVMNPRGCAGSALTTPRLFSAADSDDIEAAVKFVNQSRPWTTLVTIAWGYGANMLTKYLAEAGERTPLTAAVCIDNPFDLNEASRSLSPSSPIEDKLKDGLIEMLQNNKELFKGKNKGFDMATALSARSLREFEAAISMVPFGFESIEEFYKKSSTRELVHRVKIPLLFVQNKDLVMHLCSVPQSSIAENAFTSLLLYSRSPNVLESSRYATVWCHNLAIEWFSAVELALLKGRHPLLNDIDITISPPKSLPIIEQKLHKASYQRPRRDFYELGGSDSPSDVSVIQVRSSIGEISEDDQTQVQDHLNDTDETQESSFSGRSEKEEENLADFEKGQVLGAASVILNMLDLTLPGTLDDEQKKKILMATESGETFMKALQEAVPEDVRGKLTNAVSGIIQAQGSKINVDVLKRIGCVPSFHEDREIRARSEEVLHGNSSVPLSSDSKKDSEDHGFWGSLSEDVSNGMSTNPEMLSSMDADNEPEANKNDQMKDSCVTNNFSDAEKLSPTGEGNAQSTLGSDSSDSSSLGHSTQVNDNVDVQSTVNCNTQNALGNDPSDSSTLGNITQVNENGNIQSTINCDHSPVNAPAISVSKALDALTGFDDSTQMAMNSVFGVIENMIDQLGRETDKGNGEGRKDALESEDIVLKNVSVPSFPLSQISPLDQIPCTEEDTSNGEEHFHGHSLSDNINLKYLYKSVGMKEVPLDLKMNPHLGFSYSDFFPKSISSKISKANSLNLEATADLFLDPEEGQWKMLDQMENTNLTQNVEEMDRYTHGQHPIGQSLNHFRDLQQPNSLVINENWPKEDSFGKEELILLIRNTVVRALKVEVSRRLGNSELQDTNSSIMDDIFQVSDAISTAIGREGEFSQENGASVSVKLGTIPGQLIIRTISHVVRGTSLGRVLPVGVILGSTLASLRKYFHVSVLLEEYQLKDGENRDLEIEQQTLEGKVLEGAKVSETFTIRKGSAVAGAVTAAFGASALLAHRKKNEAHVPKEPVDVESEHTDRPVKPPDKLQEASEDEPQTNLVSTLAEKAMAVAGPVVPTTEDGEVDHERIVTSLAELGQRGGILRLIGKAALLWGGMRGAMSLTNKLISFLQIARRPLLQRILGFLCMVLIMWSPVVIPLFPTLVNNWRSTSTNSVAEYACIWGLYFAILILVVLWGKRIRDYEDPLQRYGLRFTPSAVRFFLKGFLGGIILVFYVHSINALLGFVSVVWPPVHIPHLVNTYVLVKTYGLTLVTIIQGILTATCIAAVEELLFRSWLPEEIAADLGQFHAIMISGFLFSLLQRSLTSIPGFLFLSLALCGAKQRAHGNLFLPIGIRAGTMVVNFAVQAGGLLCYRPNTPIWLASPYPWRPFDCAAGLAVCFLMAIYLRPRGLLRTDAKP